MEEPIEFLRRQEDAELNVKDAMVDLVRVVCQGDYMTGFLQFCVTNLHQYQAEQADWRIKEAILLLVGRMADRIRSEFSSMVEPMMMEHVVPETQSPDSYLKYRAIWFYGHFSGIKFQNMQHVHQVLDILFQSLYIDQLPLKVAAFTSLYKFLNGNEEAQAFLRPGLSDLLTIYLKIMDEYDNEELILGLEQLIGYYKEEMEPFTLQLV